MGSFVHSRSQCVFCYVLCCMVLLSSLPALYSQTVQVGAGSYTTALPAGATAPSSQIFSSVPGPKPTHRFWTAKNWYADNIINGSVTFGGGGGGPFVMFPQPLGMQTTATGLLMGFDAAVISGGTFFFQPFEGDLTIGVAGLNTASVNVSGYSDWTVDFNFGPMTTRVGRGMPFVYVTTNGSNPTVTFAGQPTVFANNGNILGVSIANNNYGLFCPTGGSWSGIGGTVLTCNLPSGHNYFSLALLPNSSALSTYSQFAFSFPANTQVAWNYNPNTSQVTTTYTVTTQTKEGSQNGFLMALYPHQYTALQDSAINTSFTYPSSRGTLKVLQGTSFSTADTFHGILPFLPNAGNANNATLTSFVDTVANEPNHFTVSQSGGGANSYDIGKDLGRIAHLLPIAKIAGDTTALNNLQTSLQNELQNWFNGAANHQNTNVFYYNGNWGTLIGYPGAFGSDVALNDHHFHYGYWIHSSAILGLLNPTWIQSNNWGGMVNLLGRDIATPVRNDALFPFLRHFDVYGGHSWASGQAPFGDGLNQESSSEAMNAWTGLILFATETGNTQLRDAAIWMYTQEAHSIFDYWFNDGPVATFPAGVSRVQVANVFDGKSDAATFFSPQIELEHGIEFLPFHGGSFYLGRDPAYIQKNLAEITSLDPNAFAPGSSNWPDLIEEYQALADANTAMSEFNNTSFVFDGESKAHEYYWIAQLQRLGQSDEAVTANTPLYHVFRNPSTGVVTHAAFNPGTTAITVNFSDGATLSVPAGSMRSEFGTTTLGSGSGGGGGPVGNTLYVMAGATPTTNGSLSFSPGSNASMDTVPADNGATFDGTPHNPLIYSVKGVSGTFSGGATQFSLFIDSKTAVGNGVQLQVLYDLNGDGVFDRTETYHYFPTDAVSGFENYTQASFGGLESSTGALGNMNNGTIEIMIWNAIGMNPSFVNASATTAQGSQSVLVLPFTNLTVGGSADFSLSASPASQSVTAGNSTSYTISVGALNGFSGGVALSAGGLPSGSTASFTPASVNGSGSSTLAVSTSSTTPAGNYTLTISGTSGSLTHTATVTLAVSPAQSQCLTSGTTWQNTALPVQTGTFTATFDATPSRSSAPTPINSVVALSNGPRTAFTGFAALVAFNASGIQARNGGSYTAASVIPYTGGATYHFREVVNIPAHTYSIFVTAPGGAEQTVGSSFAFRTEQNTVTQLNNWGTFASSGSLRVCNFTLFTAAPNFALAATPSSVTVTAGSPASYTTNVSAVNGFSGSVGLSVSGLPAGATATFNPASINGSGSSTLNVATGTSTPAGTYTLTIKGTSGALSHSATVTLVVTARPTADFSLSLSPSSQAVTAGNGTSYTASVTPVNGFTGTVTFAVSGLPAGVSGSFAPASVNGSGSSTLNISTASSTPAASSTLTITATSGNLSHSGTVTLTVQAVNSCVGPNCTSKRLKIVNGCGKPMWIFFQTGFNGGTLNAQNQKLLSNVGDFIEYDIPDKGLAGVRFWPGMECDNTGNNCHIGASGGPASNGFTCPATIGCAPPIDSKFEGTFGCVSSMPLSNCQTNPSANPPTPLPRADFWDTSMVDGYTLPVKVVVHGSCPPGNPGGPAGGVIDCSTLHFSDCPQHENLSTNGQFPSLADENLLRLHPTTNQIVGCYSPSSKLTIGQWQSIPNPPFTGTTFNPADPQAQMYACPTPPITPDVCRAGPAATTNFTNLIHAKCNNTYAYAYDDTNGLSSCPATTSTSYEVTFFCPQ